MNGMYVSSNPATSSSMKYETSTMIGVPPVCVEDKALPAALPAALRT